MSDKFLGFKYGTLEIGIDKTYKGFIINDGEDLKFSNSPSFSNEFVIPPYGGKTYYLGTTEENRTVSFKVMLLDTTLYNYKKVIGLLGSRTSGILSFDYDSNYGYEVKLDSISDGVYTVSENCEAGYELYNVEFEISFITLYDWAARWIGLSPMWTPTESQLIDNNLGLSFLSKVGDVFTFYNRHNVENYFVITYDNSLTIVEDTVTLVNVSGAGLAAKYYSQHGFLLKSDGVFLSGASTIIKVPANSDLELTITGTLVSIVPTSREIL